MVEYRAVPGADATLDKIDLFADLGPTERSGIASQCRWRSYAAGQAIVHHLDESRDVFFIASGAVRALVHSLSGKQISYRDMGVGEMFGEFAAIDGGPRAATVVALSDCLIGALGPQAFWDILRTHPSVNERLLKHLTGLVRRYSDRVREFATLPVGTRVQLELLRLAQPSSSAAAAIEPAPTHAEFAERVGTHREAVTRTLNQLRRAGILRTGRGFIVIENLSQLQHTVSEAIGD